MVIVLEKKLIIWTGENCVAIFLVLWEKLHFGNIVRIRSEDDDEVLKNFTQEQKDIRWKYRNKMVKKIDKQQFEKVITDMQKMFKELAGGGK